MVLIRNQWISKICMKCVFRTMILNGFTWFLSAYISISGQIVQTSFPVRWPLKLQTTHHALSDSSTTYIYIYVCACVYIYVHVYKYM